MTSTVMLLANKEITLGAGLAPGGLGVLEWPRAVLGQDSHLHAGARKRRGLSRRECEESKELNGRFQQTTKETR